jgi:acetyltransferase-like isoleucine patch superfamily enzyme
MIRVLVAMIVRFASGSASHVRNIWYRCLGVDITEYCWIRSIEIPRNWNDILLHGCAFDRGVTMLCSGPHLAGKLEIGKGTYVNRFTVFDAHEKIRVGRDVMIGPFCFITDGNHGVDGSRSVKSQPMVSKPVEIQDEAWIGAHVTILPGVTIGRGAIVGAGSVVTKDIPANCIAFGSPAVSRRYRENGLTET